VDAPVVIEAAQTLAARIARLTDRLARAARRTRRRADAEAIHDTRVTLRRLEAALDVWRDALRPRRWRRARRALRRLRRSLGPAREAEVSAALLRERLSADTSGSPADIQPVLARLERSEERARRKAARACRRGTMDRLLGRLRRPLLAGPSSSDDLVAAARGRVGRRSAAARATLAEAARSFDERALHRARITLKRWRYGLEALAGVDAGLAAASPELLEGAQRSLGSLHDLSVLRATLQECSRDLESEGSRVEAPLGRLIAALESEFRQELEALPGRAAPLARPAVVLPVARPSASSARR
jgi:CHAD domain-containing protein